MKVFRAAIIIALLAGPAYGQSPSLGGGSSYGNSSGGGHMQGYREEDAPKTAVEIQADRAAQKAYRDSLSNIPDAGPVDPWGNARAVGAPKGAKEAAKPAAKTAAKTAPPKPKTGSTANSGSAAN